MISLSEDEDVGVNWEFLQWLAPGAAVVGIWIVGKILPEQGSPWLALVAACLSYLVQLYVYDENICFCIMVFSCAFVFDACFKELRRKSHFIRKVLILGFFGPLLLFMWASHLHFNGTLIDCNGDEIPVSDYFTSSWWTDLKQSLYDTYQFAQHHGWYAVWKQVMDLTDAQGAKDAYKVLDVSTSATQAEITSKWRDLSREWHPDKVRDPALQRRAQEKFMKIKQAYEIISHIRSRCKQKIKIL